MTNEEEYRRFAERFLESDTIDGYSGEPMNVVDGLFAIAQSINALEHTLGSMPLVDMTDKIKEALEYVGNCIPDPDTD